MRALSLFPFSAILLRIINILWHDLSEGVYGCRKEILPPFNKAHECYFVVVNYPYLQYLARIELFTS